MLLPQCVLVLPQGSVHLGRTKVMEAQDNAQGTSLIRVKLQGQCDPGKKSRNIASFRNVARLEASQFKSFKKQTHVIDV